MRDTEHFLAIAEGSVSRWQMLKELRASRNDPPAARLSRALYVVSPLPSPDGQLPECHGEVVTRWQGEAGPPTSEKAPSWAPTGIRILDRASNSFPEP